MISVENFYWVLYQNLLAPSGLNCWYYYPWGTKNHISRHEYKKFDRVSDLNYVLFHFDQEPLYESNLGKLHDEKMPTWSTRFCKILANSEKSLLKKDLCRERFMLDWYFFYHAFAALDWFRDSEYINCSQPIQNAFLSLNNNISNHRSYRISMLARLLDRDMLPHGTLSFHATQADIWQIIDEDPIHWCEHEKKYAAAQVCKISHHLPINNVDGEGSSQMSAKFGHREYAMWQASLIHVVNETVFYEPKLHLTEKIFKPIVSMRPFVLLGAPGNLQFLKNYGFLTFAPWIDESYDGIEDNDLRLDHIAMETERIARMSIGELRDMLEEMRPVLEHNKQHFFGEFKKIIVDELVDNFEACLRIWNNGRVDNHSVVIPSHDHLERIKRLLSQ
jgi:hypothetical protein